MPKEIVTSGGLFTGVAISGATASTYELTTDDVEELLYCEVTATNVAGSAMKQSDATGEIAEIEPVVILATDTWASGWTLSLSSVTGTTTGPDGVAGSAETITFSDDNSTMSRSVSATDDKVHTYEIKAKAGTKSDFRFYIWEAGFAGNCEVHFDLSGGTITFESATNSVFTTIDTEMTALGSGWYLCKLITTVNATGLTIYVNNKGGSTGTVHFTNLVLSYIP